MFYKKMMLLIQLSGPPGNLYSVAAGFLCPARFGAGIRSPNCKIAAILQPFNFHKT
jgi:hypothetical protein